MDITIYHNPRCSNSRGALDLIRSAGIEPHIVEYLKTPPSRAVLAELLTRAGLTPRQAVRTKEALYRELNLDAVDDDALLDAMIEHPVLIERPIVATPNAVRICRPPEQVLELLPSK